jgi:NAD(P)-dependent dehydrogenase (short-subunit alcohol dehydrogenase family)
MPLFGFVRSRGFASVQVSPLSREIADAALFLACEASSYMTGETIAVDGGLLLG